MFPFIECQQPNPDHFFDFSQVTDVNDVEFVIDQITKDLKYSFGFLSPRSSPCPNSQMQLPTKGTDGVQFAGYKDSLRLQNSINLALTNKWMIAIWVKLFDIGGPYQFSNLIAQQRYDAYSYFDPPFRIGLNQDNNGKMGLELYSVLMISSNQSPYQYRKVVVQNSTVQNGGWALLSVSMDSSSGSNSKISYRIRAGPNGNDNFVDNVGAIYYDQNNTKSDTYIGSYCEASNQQYNYGPLATIGRLYVWKSYSNVNSDNAFDKFFFRQNGSPSPKCTGTLFSCLFCVVGYPFPPSSTSVTTLSCPTSGKSNQELFLAYWDFETDIEQYIKDQSGNNKHLMKSPINDIDNKEPYRVQNQGYYLEPNSQMPLTQSIIISNYNQYTIELWVRKEMMGPDAGSSYGFIPLEIIDNSFTGNIFMIYMSDDQQQIYFWFFNNIQMTSQFPGLFQTSKWHFVSISFYYSTWANGNVGVYFKAQVDNKVNFVSRGFWQKIAIPDDSITFIQTFRSFYLRRLRIYAYARLPDEVQYMYGTNTTCKPLANQSQCDICPADINNYTCLSTCLYNQFGDNCTNCNFMCATCTGPTKNDCLYCSRQYNTSKALYSQTYGNCSCDSGRFYDSTNVRCSLCHSYCKECFGPSNAQCLTCNSGKAFFPNSTCVSSCSDALVILGGTIGYYKQSETVDGQLFQMCVKCHPYCSQCTGGSNTQCQACQPGYFLYGGNTCQDTCPAGKYPNFATSSCDPCNSTCKTCNGPNNNNCITCTNTTLVQQSGVCKSQCDDGFYPDSSKICQPCHIACATCNSNKATDCSSCTSGYYLEWLGFSCKTSCLPGTYADNATNQCLLCHYSCTNCTASGADSCIQCAPNFLRRGSLCVTSCADDEYVVNGTCQTCDKKCSACYGTQDNQCYSCAENTNTSVGYFYFNNSCLVSCPDGYYEDNFLRQCMPCNPRCATCVSSTFCTSCIYGPYQLNNGECTYFTCLDTQYRSIKPSLACYQCDSSCLTCQGQSQFDCLSCKTTFKLIAQQCMTCSEQPGMTEPLDEGATDCVEICGDGYNYGNYQCDDGNLINGDGCSSKCQIEDGFYCTPGNKFSPSVCVDNKNPTPKISLVNSKNYIYIQFDEEVILSQTLDTNTLQITVTGPQSSYVFDWKLNSNYANKEPTQLIIIETTFYQSLKGEQKEQIVLQFKDPLIYTDAAGNGILTKPLYGYLNKYEYIDPTTKAQLNAAGDSSMLATIGAVAINLGISLVFGGSISAMWVMVNTIQLVSLLPLCSINYPPITILVFQKMLSSHGESTFIPNIFYDYIINKPGVIIEEPLNLYFSDYGWTVSNFLYLSGRKILIWLGLLIAYPIIYYMKKKYADKHKFCRLWRTAESKFRYTLILRGMLMSYVSMYLAFILNIFKMSFETMENVLSAFFAIAFGIMLTYLPIQIMNILQRNYEKIQSEKFMTAYSTIVKEVDLSHPLRYMYYPVFLMRRALFAIQLVLFANQPLAQIGVMSATAVIMIIYVVIIKPQKEKVMIALTACGEGILLFLHLFSIVFLDENLSEDKSNRYGWFVIVLVGLYILVNWLIILTITIINLKKQWGEYKQKKLKQKEQEKEDREFRKWKKKKHIKKQLEDEYEKQRMLHLYEHEQQRYQEQNKNQLLQKQKDGYQNLPVYHNKTEIYEENFIQEENPIFNGLSAGTPANVFNGTNRFLFDQIQQQEQRMLSAAGTERYQSNFMIQTGNSFKKDSMNISNGKASVANDRYNQDEKEDSTNNLYQPLQDEIDGQENSGNPEQLKENNDKSQIDLNHIDDNQDLNNSHIQFMKRHKNTANNEDNGLEW